MDKILEFLKESRILSIPYIFAISLVIMLFYSMNYAIETGNVRNIGVPVGIASIVFLLTSTDKDKSISVLIAVMMIGTLVAREEFILEAVAMAKGENITDVRSSRLGAPSYAQQESAEIKKELLNKELTVALESYDIFQTQSEQVTDAVVQASERVKLVIDTQKLTPAAKAMIRMLATEGGIYGDEDLPVWEKYFTSRGLDSVEGATQLKDLGYLIVTSSEYGYLSEQGIELAKHLGYEVVDQKPPSRNIPTPSAGTHGQPTNTIETSEEEQPSESKG